ESDSFGVIMNSFQELELEYERMYKKVKKDKVWCVGPVSLINKDQLKKVQRGNNVSVEEWKHQNWPDSQKPKSVIYACLGSLSNVTTIQLIEIGLALEESIRPFIWVIREGNQLEALEKWIKEDGFEERIKGSSSTNTVTSFKWRVLDTLWLELYFESYMHQHADADVA
ncbi:hypothetical protein S83_026164, partial [Arachis hypogaea]